MNTFLLKGHSSVGILIEHLELQLWGTQYGVWTREDGEVTLRDCVFSVPSEENEVTGVTANDNSTLHMERCRFGPLATAIELTENAQGDILDGDHRAPGGVAFSTVENSRLVLQGCRVGTSSFIRGHSLEARDCQFAGIQGLLVLRVWADSLLLERSVIRACNVEQPLIQVKAQSFICLRQCLLVDNHSTLWNAPLLDGEIGAGWALESCLISRNSMRLTSENTPTPSRVTCCNLFENPQGDWDGVLAPFAGQDGNLSLDPRICDWQADTLEVALDSPCLPEHNTCTAQIGNLSVGCTIPNVTAGFGVTVREGFAPMVVAFQNESAGPVDRVQWDFESDGTWDSEMESPIHVYEGEGHWSVSLRVSNSEFADTLRLENLIHSHVPRLLRVPEEYPTVAAGLAAVEFADTVEVSCGDYHEHDLELPDWCILRSVSREPDCVRLLGDEEGRLLDGRNLEHGSLVEGLTLSGGRDVHQGAGSGGAVRLMYSNACFRRCVFSGNHAWRGGVGSFTVRDSIVIEDCVLVGNSCDVEYSTWVFQAGPLRMRRCLVSGNSGGKLFNQAPEISCTDIHGNSDGNWVDEWAESAGRDGNLEVDPLYCDALAGDFRLLPDSPCLPPASACGAMGAFPGSCLTRLQPPTRPLDFAVAAWPNPFNPVTWIHVQLPVAARVELRLFNLAGQLVWEAAADGMAAGGHEWRLDGSGWASGVYLLDVRADGWHAVRKLTLLK